MIVLLFLLLIKIITVEQDALFAFVPQTVPFGSFKITTR